MNSLNDLDATEIDLTIVAVDNIDPNILLEEDRLFEAYLFEDERGALGLESFIINGYYNLENLIRFLLGPELNLSVLNSKGDKQLFDLTAYKENCISFEDLELKYKDWILLSKRKNSMDEYGSLLGLIGYIQKNKTKKHLMLITEKHCA